MNSGARSEILRLSLYAAAVSIVAGIFCAAALIFNVGTARPVSAQIDPLLERRVSQMEQRFYSIESRISRLEQTSRFPSAVPPLPTQTGGNDIEIRLLRSEIETLRLRVGEAECGLLKLDERTLAEAARQTRLKAAAGKIEPCRANAAAPLQLSARP